jgi:hypothetical protein
MAGIANEMAASELPRARSVENFMVFLSLSYGLGRRFYTGIIDFGLGITVFTANRNTVSSFSAGTCFGRLRCAIRATFGKARRRRTFWHLGN